MTGEKQEHGNPAGNMSLNKFCPLIIETHFSRLTPLRFVPRCALVLRTYSLATLEFIGNPKTLNFVFGIVVLKSRPHFIRRN